MNYEYPPTMNMSQPNKRDYQAQTIEIKLYSYYEKFRHDDYEDDDDEDDEEDISYQDNINTPDGKKHWWSHDRHQPPNPDIKFNKLTLQDLIDLLPEGITPKDVKVRSSIDYGDMGIYGHEVIFYYKKKVPADPKAYERDYAVWQKLHADWEKRNAAYEEKIKNQEIEQKQKEIRDLQERLAKLKK